MNKQEFEAIRSNWEAIRPNARFAARLFYTKLLLIDPSLAPLFRRNPEEQSQRLLRATGIAVYGISQPRILQPLLRMLGRHPAVRRMTPSQFESIGQALWVRPLGTMDWESHQGLAMVLLQAVPKHRPIDLREQLQSDGARILSAALARENGADRG